MSLPDKPFDLSVCVKTLQIGEVSRLYSVISSVLNNDLEPRQFRFQLLSHNTLSLCSIIVLLVSSK